MKKVINILIHPYYTEESSKILDVYDQQLEKGNFNIILFPQVSKTLKKVILDRHKDEFIQAFLSVKNKSDVDKVFDKENIHKHLFHLHHTALILRQIYFSSHFRHIKRKNKTMAKRKLNRKRSGKILKRFINRLDIQKPILKLSKKLTVFKDDVIFKWSTEARSYLENKFKSNKEQIVVHVDGGSFHTVESVMRYLKKTMCDELENYDVKVFGEYRNLCVKGLEVILTNYEIDYKVIEELCSYNLCNNRVFKPEEREEDYFYIKRGEEQYGSDV